MTAYKAYVAAAAGFVIPILTWLSSWLMSGDAWSWRSFWSAVVTSALTSLGSGGITYAMPNKPKVVGEHTAAGVALENSHSASMEG